MTAQIFMFAVNFTVYVCVRVDDSGTDETTDCQHATIGVTPMAL